MSFLSPLYHHKYTNVGRLSRVYRLWHSVLGFSTTRKLDVWFLLDSIIACFLLWILWSLNQTFGCSILWIILNEVTQGRSPRTTQSSSHSLVMSIEAIGWPSIITSDSRQGNCPKRSKSWLLTLREQRHRHYDT